MSLLGGVGDICGGDGDPFGRNGETEASGIVSVA